MCLYIYIYTYLYTFTWRVLVRPAKAREGEEARREPRVEHVLILHQRHVTRRTPLALHHL